jgi:peptidoglycan hydrolase-like protein with peptidoglycan-binding domain/lysophospholipase L1-like esterase
MRFREFRVLKEDTSTQYVTIGDSHAVAVAQAGGAGWTNLAVGGSPSAGTHPTVQTMLGNISKVPKGSVVLVSLGANDTANAFRAAVETKKKLRDPQSIAGDVAAVVDKVKAQNPSQVVFLLFPNGTGRTDKNKDAQWYGGDYQEAVRSAIKSAVGVPVIDINGASLPDGVHAGMSTYRDVANKVKAGYKGASGQATVAGRDKPAGIDNVEGAALTQLTVPTGRIGPDVADIQKVLVALGYDLPKYGVDGVRGNETSTAVRKFQQDNNLKVDGDPGPETVSKLNSILKSDTKLAGKLTKSSKSDVKARVLDAGAKVAPIEYNAVTKGKIGKLLDLIAKPESGGHYDIMMGGTRNPKILKMTIAELLQYQRAYKAGGHETAAAGRYQFMPETLKNVARRIGLDFNKDVFDPETQDKLAIDLLREKGLGDWLNGSMSDSDFMDRLAQVWAGLPSPSKGGASWYDKVGSNKAGMTVAAVQNTLNDIKTA